MSVHVLQDSCMSVTGIMHVLCPSIHGSVCVCVTVHCCVKLLCAGTLQGFALNTLLGVANYLATDELTCGLGYCLK